MMRRLISSMIGLLSIVGLVALPARVVPTDSSPAGFRGNQFAFKAASDSLPFLGVANENELQLLRRSMDIGTTFARTAAQKQFLLAYVSSLIRQKAASSPLNTSTVKHHHDLEKAGYSRIKLKLSLGRYLTVRGVINQKPVNLIVDTGAPRTNLDRKRTAHLKLLWHDVVIDIRTNKTVPARPFAPLRSIEFGSFRLDGMVVVEHDLREINQYLESINDDPVDGVIGADVLESCGAVIDYRAPELLLKRAERVGPKEQIR